MALQPIQTKDNILKFNLGSGKRNLDGFINIDAIEHTPQTVVGDILNLDYEDNVATELYSEHVIEHLDRNQLDMFFKECKRLLVSGGIMTIVGPCLRDTIKDYVEGLFDITYLDNFMYALHEHEYDYHKQGIFKEKFEMLCEKHNLNIIEIKYQARGREREVVLVAELMEEV